MRSFSRKMTIAGTDIGNYTIVLAAKPRPVEITAANTLHDYIQKSCNVDLPIKDDTTEYENEIVIGLTAREKYYSVDRSSFGDDGYVIFNNGKRLVFAGALKRGTLYAVYDFLEYVIGWKFYARDTEVMRGDGDIVVPADYRREFVPVFEYRELDGVCARERHIASKLRLNGTYRKFGEELGGEFNWGGEIHSFANYFDIDERTQQPCLSDPDNIKIVIEKIAKRLEENPDLDVFEISQNDNQNFCKCDRCRQIDEEEESHSGTLIRFMNQLSDAFRDKYPKLHFQTFAYEYTLKPPKITKPRDNIIIKMCPMGQCPTKTIFDPRDKYNSEFCQYLDEWHKIADKIYIWDYVTNYIYFIAPFPDLCYKPANMRYYADHHVKGVYPEGNYICESGEFNELRSYLLSKLLWNPYMSEAEYEEEEKGFLEAYYGAGWEGIYDFIKLTEEEAAKHPSNIWTHPFEMVPRNVYRENEKRIEKDWDEAERLAIGIQKDHVRRSRCQYTLIRLTLDYDKRYKEGDEKSREAYMTENLLFYNYLVKNDIGMREAAMFPCTVDFKKPPLKWYLPSTIGYYPGDPDQMRFWIDNDFI